MIGGKNCEAEIQQVEFEIQVFETSLYVKKIELICANENANAPVIMLMHEGLGCTGMWKDFQEVLCRTTGLSVISVDRLGYGNSDPYTGPSCRPDYLEVEALERLPETMKALDLDAVIFFGHSDGGTLALHYAANYPEKVKGIISLAAHLYVDDLTLKGIREATKAYDDGLKEKLEKYHGSNTDTIFSRWSESWLSEAFQSWNLVNEISGVTCPVLVIQGEKDQYGTMDQVEAIYNAVSGYKEKCVIPECRHVPHHEARDVVLETTKQFINDSVL